MIVHVANFDFKKKTHVANFNLTLCESDDSNERNQIIWRATRYSFKHCKDENLEILSVQQWKMKKSHVNMFFSRWTFRKICR